MDFFLPFLIKYSLHWQHINCYNQMCFFHEAIQFYVFLLTMGIIIDSFYFNCRCMVSDWVWQLQSCSLNDRFQQGWRPHGRTHYSRKRWSFSRTVVSMGKWTLSSHRLSQVLTLNEKSSFSFYWNSKTYQKVFTNLLIECALITEITELVL